MQGIQECTGDGMDAWHRRGREDGNFRMAGGVIWAARTDQQQGAADGDMDGITGADRVRRHWRGNILEC